MKKYVILIGLGSLACSKPQTAPVPAMSQNMVVCPKCGTPIALPPKESLMNKIFG